MQISQFFRLHPRYALEFWVACNILAMVLSLAESQGWQNFSWTRFIDYALYIHWILFSFIACMDTLQRRYIKLSLNQWMAIGFVLLQGIILSTTLTLNVVTHFGQYFHFHTLTARIILGEVGLHLSYGILLGALCFRYLFLREQWIRQQHSELNARIQALQARIHPHFLFNSLNNVISLIQIDPNKAETVLLDLSKLFRASLQELKLVNLNDEIELCRRYLAIEQIRLGDRLKVEWKFAHPEAFSTAQIPLLTLQPLLENSIFHGVEHFLTPSPISILVEVIDRQINIVITNPYMADQKRQRKGNGVALANVKQRLQAYYGDEVIFKHHAGNAIFTTVVQYQYK